MPEIPVNAQTLGRSPLAFGQLLRLGKPRVVSLIVFTAIIAMFLATPGLPPVRPLLFGAIGIALLATSAAALNCVIEQRLDRLMARTRARPLPRGEVTEPQALVFMASTGIAGLLILHGLVNPLTTWLTLATFMGYGVVYTVVLKPRTPQNIVLGGAAGAMPPVLGWAAVTGEVSADAVLLFLIIFAWTPPHFWALAIARRDDYARAGIPMLPVTHGVAYTRLQVLLYTVLLTVVTLMPYLTRMSGLIYLAAALGLNSVFLYYALALKITARAGLPMRVFRFSVNYLMWLFAALLIDHYLPAFRGSP